MTQRHSSIAIHGLHEHAAAHGVQRLKLLQRAKKWALSGLALLLIGAAVVLAFRFSQSRALAAIAQEQSRIYVKLVVPKISSSDSTLTLPGTLQGFVEAPIYARASGYIERWYKDIGEHVNQGDLLAQISAPEVAQQLIEAKASQEQARTNAQLAQTSFTRWESLLKQDAVSQQEVDERRNALAVANAVHTSATAAVHRLQELVSYSRIVAPFSGVITKRNIDIGNLVDAGSGTKLLFTIAKIDPLRVYVYVPQNYAQQIRVGSKTEIRLRELPGKIFSAQVVRTAGAIDPLTRTLQLEISLANTDGQLLPGAYVQVSIKSKDVHQQGVSIPSNTLLFRPEGPTVAVVDSEGKVRLQRVSIKRELGTEVELSDGVSIADRLIINPPDAIISGDIVSVIADKRSAP